MPPPHDRGGSFTHGLAHVTARYVGSLVLPFSKLGEWSRSAFPQKNIALDFSMELIESLFPSQDFRYFNAYDENNQLTATAKS